MGMALDESIENMQKLESNGVEAYIDPKVADSIKSMGDISIDFVTRPEGSGYSIKVGDPDCSSGGCDGCG
jgi:Fe-S cluster assembly iron-binding protein IscA